MTLPAGTVALDALVTTPSTRPALAIALAAALCVKPTTLGTVTCGGPDETISDTLLPGGASEPAIGDWSITRPAATVLLDAVVTAPSTNPSFAIASPAAACVNPTTFGTTAGVTAVDPARISTAAAFQRSLVGAVSLIVTDVPALGTGFAYACTKNVAAGAESLATAYTSEFGFVVASETLSGPKAELADATAPVPPAPLNATSVSD